LGVEIAIVERMVIAFVGPILSPMVCTGLFVLEFATLVDVVPRPISFQGFIVGFIGIVAVFLCKVGQYGGAE
jgi:hypothetical protein